MLKSLWHWDAESGTFESDLSEGNAAAAAAANHDDDDDDDDIKEESETGIIKQLPSAKINTRKRSNFYCSITKESAIETVISKSVFI